MYSIQTPLILIAAIQYLTTRTTPSLNTKLPSNSHVVFLCPVQSRSGNYHRSHPGQHIRHCEQHHEYVRTGLSLGFLSKYLLTALVREEPHLYASDLRIPRDEQEGDGAAI
jgi:hypothetical protein